MASGTGLKLRSDLTMCLPVAWALPTYELVGIPWWEHLDNTQPQIFQSFEMLFCTNTHWLRTNTSGEHWFWVLWTCASQEAEHAALRLSTFLGWEGR